MITPYITGSQPQASILPGQSHINKHSAVLLHTQVEFSRLLEKLYILPAHFIHFQSSCYQKVKFLPLLRPSVLFFFPSSLFFLSVLNVEVWRIYWRLTCQRRLFPWLTLLHSSFIHITDSIPQFITVGPSPQACVCTCSMCMSTCVLYCISLHSSVHSSVFAYIIMALCLNGQTSMCLSGWRTQFSTYDHNSFRHHTHTDTHTQSPRSGSFQSQIIYSRLYACACMCAHASSVFS